VKNMKTLTEYATAPAGVTSPAAWPCFGSEEIDAACAVLRSGRVNYWTGEQGRLFEQEFAAFIGCNHAVALANGTVALECALKALGIGPGDEVVTTSRTFIASASCAVTLGARPVIAENEGYCCGASGGMAV
jgi:dTDP-4-amino-4,6-dideoxygalactose transaminase